VHVYCNFSYSIVFIIQKLEHFYLNLYYDNSFQSWSVGELLYWPLLKVEIAPAFAKTAPTKSWNSPYTGRAKSPLTGRIVIGAILTPQKNLFCGHRFGPIFGVVSALFNLQCACNWNAFSSVWAIFFIR
jgi:hypothetical protein